MLPSSMWLGRYSFKIKKRDRAPLGVLKLNMKPEDRCPQCNGELSQIEEGVVTMYVCDVLYCDNCDKQFDLDEECQPEKYHIYKKLLR